MATNPNHPFLRFSKVALAAALVFALRDAQAQLFQEGFNYNSGDSLSGSGPWTGGSANLTINSGSLSYSGPPSLGGNSLSVVSGSGASSVSVANFTSTPITTGSVYYSFLAECTSLPVSGNSYLTSILPSGAAGPNGGSDPLAVYAASVSGSSTTFRFGVRSGGSGATYATSPNFTTGAVNLFVVEYTFGGNVSLWVNPTVGAGSPPTADVSVAAGTAAANLQEVGFKAQSAAAV